MRQTRFLVILLVVAAATVVVGLADEVTVTIKEWTVPTANSRPHDPLVAPDGNLWLATSGVNGIDKVEIASK